MNGDGLPDVVSGGGARAAVPAQRPFNIEIDDCGLPAITSSDGYYPEINMTDIPSFTDEVVETSLPAYDLVRVWRCQIPGKYQIFAPATYTWDSIPGSTFLPEDSVTISVEYYGRYNNTPVHVLLADTTLGIGNSVWDGNLADSNNMFLTVGGKGLLKMDGGENGVFMLENDGLLFFRARTAHGEPTQHLLRWSPQVVKSDTARDPNRRLSPDADSAGRCQLLQGDGLFICPFGGIVRYDDCFNLDGFSDAACYEVWHNGTLVTSRCTSDVVSHTFNVLKDDTLKFFFRCGSNVDLAAHPWFPKIYYTDVYYDTVITQTTHFSVADQESFAFWPLPKYDYWEGFYKVASTAGQTDMATIYTNPAVMFDSVFFVVKSNNATTFRQKFTPTTADLRRQVQSGDFLECYLPDGGVPGLYQYNTPLYAASDSHVSLPVIFRFKGAADLLYGRFYGGWSQFQYRHDDLPLMDIAKLERLATASTNPTALSQTINNLRDQNSSKVNDTAILRAYAETNNLLSSNLFCNQIFDCLPLTANGETRRHEGMYPNSWIKGDTLSLGCLPTAIRITEEDGMDTVYSPDEQNPNGNGSASGQKSGTAFNAKATDKVSHTLGVSASAGIVKIGANGSYSTTKTVRDFMDLNGDGVPDFIDKDDVCYSLPCRSDGKVRWESGWRTVFGGKCSSNSYSFSTGLGYTAQKEKLLETTRNSNKGNHAIVADGSVSGNVSTAWDHTVLAMIDMNGDGLPDKVDNNGNVSLNKGYGFMEAQKWDSLDNIGKHSSASLSASAGIYELHRNVSVWKASYSGGVSRTESVNTQKYTLADMNGDGLPDLVHRYLSGKITYQLNTGSGFEGRCREWAPRRSGTLLWGTSATISASLKATFGGAAFGCKVGGTPSVNGSETHTNSRLQIMDFDGDGIPDLLKSDRSSHMEVRHARIGRTGLLKSVTTPLGGSVTLGYHMTDASVFHSRRWVMDTVLVCDSLPGDGSDIRLAVISYANGYYDRTEREFLGFAVVAVNSLNVNGDTLRRSVRYYDNRNVHAKGSLLCEALLGKYGQAFKPWLVTTCSYDTVHVPFVSAGNTYRSVFQKLIRRQTCFFEDLQQARITAWEEFDYENTHGNVVRQRQGSTSQLMVEANISYHVQYNNNYCVNRVSSVEITGYKKRTTEVDNKGHYTVFRDYYDNTHSLATRLQYDNYGNVTTMRGPNTTVYYTYDNFVHSYPTAITDTFGVTSQMQDYDFRFGVPLTMVDHAGSQMLYTIDGWGRIITIRGPKEIAAGKPFTIRHTYTGREPAPAGTTRQRAVSMAMTEHYDPQHSNIPNSPDNPIKTYTYCDGLGRIVQTRKEAAVNGVEKLVVSGHTVVDALGRTVETYYPTEIHMDSTRFRFITDQSAPASTVTYDILDRPLVQTAPDGSTTTFQYGFENSHLGMVLFKTTTTDANGHSSIELKDVSGRPWAVQPAGQHFVYFNYNQVGDNTMVYSSQPDDWERNYTYDWLGRRLTYAEGELAETLTYDGGNLSTHTQSWSENGNSQSKTTTYHYTAHRLDSVCYDDALTTIYHYDQYGRVDSLYDESGVMCYQYGNMGEVTSETRIYALPFLSSPLALSTQFTYDSWGRILDITYPDNEIVNYTYDLGGQLQSITNNSSSYTYLDNVAYDRFGAKVSQEYGNGITTDYSYDNVTRRLMGITTTGNGTPLSQIQYAYDLVGNVTQMTSSCPWLPNHSFTESFSYDASDQLVSASETNSGSYQLAVTYGNWGKINSYSLTQTDLQSNVTTQDAYTFGYPNGANNMQQSQTMFAPETRTGTSDADFSFGINGSLRKVETRSPSPSTEHYLFNSAANLKAYSNNLTDFAYYGYNASNTRAYKLGLSGSSQWVNGQQQSLHLGPQQAMFYPNAYINFNQNGEYTKHYYNGAERIASRLGGNQQTIEAEANDRLLSRIAQTDELFKAQIGEMAAYEEPAVNVPARGNGEGTRNLLFPSVGYDPIPAFSDLQPTGNTTDIFYYHTNHLGSTAFVTDQNQNVTQGFLYAPFGEITTEYNATFGNDIIPKYSFNAKELDEETGMYYYEARYYKPPVFTSRDPMFEKYFWMTPYAYCANNPVKYVDPDGEAWKPTFNEETGEYTGYQWIDPKYSYNSDGTLKDGLYEQAIFFSENGTYNPESKYNIGSSTATVYKSDGTTETFDACTHPSSSSYATVPAGIYEATVGLHNGKYTALRMGDVGGSQKIELGKENPAYSDGRTYAIGINAHKSGINNFTGIGRDGRPVSKGCLLIDRNRWSEFIGLFNNSEQKNNTVSITVSRTMSAPTNRNVSKPIIPIQIQPIQADKTRVAPIFYK